MQISKRRLRWAAIGLLIACVLLMLRPTRTWIEQAWIARALSPQLTVGELVIHSQKSIIEARELKWHVCGSSTPESSCTAVRRRAFGVSARRCWLAVDRDSLPSGRLHLPKVILQDANFFLETGLPSASNSLENWQHRLARQTAGFSWDALQKKPSCLLATEQLRSAWCQRIEGWLERSPQIQIEAAQLEHQIEAMDNPLRFEQSIKAKLMRYQQLADEQRSLVCHLDQLEESLVTESVRLNQLHEQDLRSLVELTTEVKLGHRLDSNHAGLEREFAVALGDAVWNQLAPYGEIVDNISHGAVSIRTADYDVTVRPVEYGAEHLQRSELKAAGVFRVGIVKARYQTSGTWRIAQNSPAQTFREFNFFTAFQVDSGQLNVSCQYDSRQSTINQLQIVMTEGQQPTAKMADSSPSDHAVELAQPTQATLASDAGKLTGSLIVSPRSLTLLPWRMPVELLESIGNHSDQPLRFDVSGGWEQPHFKFHGAAPVWLEQAVEKLAIQQSQAAIAQSQLRLDTEFGNQLLQLRQLVDVVLRDARRATAADEKELLARQSRMHKRLDSTSGAEFARRPGEVNR
ncbi:MAG: hypothetical protein KDA72_16105 [Planctomycetales bacterium]|nr:hypothetical protein [Planctomycetales bacterium]